MIFLIQQLVQQYIEVQNAVTTIISHLEHSPVIYFLLPCHERSGNFCPYMCDHSSMCFWKCYNFRIFSGHVKLNLSQHLGAVPPDPHFQILLSPQSQALVSPRFQLRHWLESFITTTTPSILKVISSTDGTGQFSGVVIIPLVTSGHEVQLSLNELKPHAQQITRTWSNVQCRKRTRQIGSQIGHQSIKSFLPSCMND